MTASATPEGPPLRPAPDRRTAPLPGSFTLHPARSTTQLDAGTVVLGGSPLRLFRISARAARLVERWRAGHVVGDRPGAQLLARRLVSSGAYVPRPTAPSLNEDDVTVVIPVRDRPAQLDRLLHAVSGLACVVVDDASADAGRTKEIAENHGARFVALTSNGGPAAARNAGLAVVHTPLVAFVDSDCVPSPGWLDPLLGHFDDPVVAAVAPRVVPAPAAPDTAADAVRAYEEVRSSLDRGPTEGLVRRGSPIPYVPSAAVVVRVAAASAPDLLFDPTLRGGEDVDLVWRLADAGWDVRYVPASTVAHDGPATLGELLARRTFYGASAAPLSRRHRGALAPLDVSGWSLAVWVLAAKRRPVLALATLAASIGLLARRLRGLTDEPVAVATRIAGDGTVRSAVPALSGLARAWSPALLAGLAFRRTRTAAALALVVPALADWRKDKDRAAGLPAWSYLVLHVADDAAYGAGVWLGCARERTIAPLVPHASFRTRVWSARTLQESLSRGAESPPTPG